MFETRGRELLEEQLGTTTQAKLAELLGVGQSAVSHWVRGASRPEAHHRLVLWVLFKIPETAWMTPAEEAVVARARAIAAPPAAAVTPKKRARTPKPRAAA
jgi:transcriptional regulator with XRE-family HTH domain